MEKNYVTIHGIELVLGSEILNLKVESIEGDLTDSSQLIPGRIYFDVNSGQLKYVDADSTSIRPLANVHQVNEKLIQEEAKRLELQSNLQGQITDLNAVLTELSNVAIRSDVTDTQVILGDLKVDGNVITSNVFLLDLDSTSQPGLGVVKADNSQLVFLKYDPASGKVKVVSYFDPQTNSQVYDEVATKSEIDALNNFISQIQSEISAIETQLLDLTSRINVLENKNQIYIFEATTASETYTITHNLNTFLIEVMMQVYDSANNVQKNDVVSITQNDPNTIKVSLSTAKLIKAIIRKAG